MAATTYKKLALRWQPSHGENRLFSLVAIVCVVALLLFGAYLSSIDLPKKPRQQRSEVPERVAKFIAQQEKPKPKPKPVPPKPKPPEPPPEPLSEPEPEPPPEPVKVVRERPKTIEEPLTESQQEARDVAAQSGLMAHLSELQDLVDTADAGAQVRNSINNSGPTEAAKHSAEVLTTDATQGSGGVDASRYRTVAGDSQLGEADLAAAQAALAANQQVFDEVKETTSDQARSRSEEEISLVFDRHKSQLQSLYNRARRSNPALKGKLVLEITILPDGSVEGVKVLSSELNDDSLVRRMLARIKSFQFADRDVAVATVSYPIEFLPY